MGANEIFWVFKGEATKDIAQRFDISDQTVRNRLHDFVFRAEEVGLMEAAKEYDNIFLWTIDALQAAGSLYMKNGFKLTEEKRHVMWGVDVNEQRFDLRL